MLVYNESLLRKVGERTIEDFVPVQWKISTHEVGTLKMLIVPFRNGLSCNGTVEEDLANFAD
jgi:hypothetical protein